MNFTMLVVTLILLGAGWTTEAFSTTDNTPISTASNDAEEVLFIAAGRYTEDYGPQDTQTIHLANGEGYYVCDKPELVPTTEFYSTPSFQINGNPVICGYSGNCMRYLGEYWEDYHSIFPVAYTVAVQLDEGRAWLAGGYNRDDFDDVLTETLIYSDEGLSPGPELPFELNGHCIAKIDDDRYIFAGGYALGEYNMETLIYNWATTTWSIGPNLPLSRESASCGVVESAANGKEFVITGGYGDLNNSIGNATYNVQHLTTDIMNLETYTWSKGPSLNAFRISAPSVPYRNTFLVAGGIEYFDDHYLGPTGHNTILEYVPGVNVWIERPERLTLPKVDFHASIVSYDIAYCELG